MKTYQHILLATDLHEANLFIIERAGALAKALGARLTLLHVVERVPQDHLAVSVLPNMGGALVGDPEEHPDRLAQIEYRAGQNLTRIAAQLGLDSPDLQVTVGKPEREIVKVADEVGADLIVVGSHERHGLALSNLHTADGVLHHAHCDVLAVHLHG
ncbi:MAG: universal stress protein [Pseudomonadota bacterium]|nr:universal stress protein [Pseudomonadota bacterium]